MFKGFHKRSDIVPLVLAALSAIGLIVIGVAESGCSGKKEPRESSSGLQALTNFRESAAVSGIDFHMSFLPAEQGQTFKINLYDHGCGVAVGDFDGDGFDDIYFVNQLGRNALYRNKGDGTFEDVTEQAGVGLGDRVCVAATWADFDNDGKQDLFV